jgi:hypothetical protein
MEHIGWILLAALASGFGGYFGSYLKKKGENLATHEDLDKLVKQVEATTEATKRIEASISNDVWDRQRHWELKKEAVFEVMRALGKADETLHFASVAEVEARKPDNAGRFEQIKTESWDSFYSAIDDFDRKRALALIVCEAGFNNTLIRLKVHLRRIGHQLLEKEIASYEDYISTSDIKKDFALAYRYARTELRIVQGKAEPSAVTPQSNVSSAVPGPGPQGPEVDTQARH